MSTPVISVAFSAETEEHVLMVTSYGRTAEAGPRILRAPPHPDIVWRHTTEATATHDAGLLQRYLTEREAGKKISKKAQRAFGE
jgi:hypothetical protein